MFQCTNLWHKRWQTFQAELQTRGSASGLDSQILEHLRGSYGTAAEAILTLVEQQPALGRRLVDDLPYLRAEVIYACREKMAVTPLDVLARRTSITLEDRHQGLGVIEDVSALMAGELGWSPEQQSEMSATFRREIERQRAARHLQPQTISSRTSEGKDRLQP